MPVQTTVQMRRDTAANWTSTNPTLASGEWGLETDTGMTKIGDGTNAWNSLAYEFAPFSDEVIATDPNGAYFTGSGLRMYGNASNFVSTPDAAALDITSDIDIRVKIALEDWTPTGGQVFVAKEQTNTTRSYRFNVSGTGVLNFLWSLDGTANPGQYFELSSSVATNFADGSTNWVRVTLDVDNGAGQNELKFYTSSDGTNWTQLGSTRTQSGTTSIFNSNSILEIGSRLAGASLVANGTIYRAQVLNGINGTTAFDANFETVPADSFAFTESSTNAATVTLTTTRYSFGLPAATLTGTTTGSLVLNNTYYNGFSVRGKPITVKHIAFECTAVPTSTSNVRIGIYAADANMQPTGNIIYSSDQVQVLTAGAAIYRIRVTPFVLNPGNYIIGLNPSQTFTIRQYTGNMAFALNTLGANLQRYYQVAANLSGAALPTSGTKWNAKNTAANTAALNLVLLGWS